MSLTPFNVQGFGGWVMTDPAEIGLDAALEVQNVEIGSGVVRSRDGYGSWAATTNAVSHLAAIPYGGVNTIFMADTAKKVATYSATSVIAGAISGSLSAAGTGAYTSFTHIGTPTAEYVYAFNSTTAETLRWNGTAWSAVSIANGGLSTLMPTDNRLVVTTGTANPSRVAFSDAGAPETFGANNYVDLEPGSGGPIIALATWQQFVIAFKRDRFFVFYGNSTDASGNPVFNYRAVYCGVGPTDSAQVTVGRDGVYFHDPSRGVFMTVGDTPRLLSGALQPVWDGQGPRWSGSGVAAASLYMYPYCLAYANERLYLSCDSGGTQVMFVLDLSTGAWTRWILAQQVGRLVSGDNTTALTLSGASAQPGPIFSTTGSTATNFLFKFITTATTDNHAPFLSYYRSGFSDFGLPGREKTVRQTDVVGTGTVSLGWARDMGSTTSTSTANLTLGTTPNAARGLHRLAQNGELLSYLISGVAGGAWQINELTPMLRLPRQPGEKSS